MSDPNAEDPITPPAGSDASSGEAAPTSKRRQKLLSEYVHEPEKVRRILGFEPVLVGRIVNLGLPVIIGMLTQTAINQIDAMMVGRLPERMAVVGTAALTPALIYFWFFGGFLASIQVGTQAVVARRYGAGDARGAGRALLNSIGVAIAASVVVTAIAFFSTGPVFDLIGHAKEVRDVEVSYASIRVLGIFSMVAMQSYKAFYDGLGRVLVFMYVAFVMNLINAALNYLLIFGNFGFPSMGVDGAAWASVISSVIGVIVMILWSLRTKDRKAFRVYRPKNVNVGVAWTVARLSFFSGLAQVFVMTGFGVFYAIVGEIDKVENLPGINVNATSIIINLAMLVFMTCIAFGTSTATLVSQSLGAGNGDLAERYGWQSVKLMVPLMGLVGLFIVLFPEPFLRLYLPADASDTEGLKDAVMLVAIPSLRVTGFLAPVAAAALVLTQALYGAGESRFVMIVELFLHFFCLVPLAYIFAVTFEQGLLGCWYAAIVYGTSLLLATGWKFYGGSWKRTVI
jgi:putative MATE family efflux protein